MANEKIDWSQLWYPGPTRRFTEEEMAVAGRDAPSATMMAVGWINFLLLVFVVLQLAPSTLTATLSALLLGAAFLGRAGVISLWREPTRKRLAVWSVAGTALVVALTIAMAGRHLETNGLEKAWLKGCGLGAGAVLSLLWWFVTLYRAHQIEGRLRERTHQARALELARQLTAAQIQPHFLFNSLASLQHWVEQKDDRAPQMLDALTRFLRATLPLFNRERLALHEEWAAVEAYMDVMRLRLGERLRPTLSLTPEAGKALLPPGLLLTLVENAIEHGVGPSLSGADVAVTARTERGRLLVEVRDNGAGLPDDPTPGVGLRNCRERLVQAFGNTAHLTLDPAPGGGARAVLDLPAGASAAGQA